MDAAPSYGAVPRAARPRKSWRCGLAALGGAGLLLAAVAVARAPARGSAPTTTGGTSSFSMMAGAGLGAVEPARPRAAPAKKAKTALASLGAATDKMRQYRAVVDTLNAKAALKHTSSVAAAVEGTAPYYNRIRGSNADAGVETDDSTDDGDDSTDDGDDETDDDASDDSTDDGDDSTDDKSDDSTDDGDDEIDDSTDDGDNEADDDESDDSTDDGDDSTDDGDDETDDSTDNGDDETDDSTDDGDDETDDSTDDGDDEAGDDESTDDGDDESDNSTDDGDDGTDDGDDGDDGDDDDVSTDDDDDFWSNFAQADVLGAMCAMSASPLVDWTGCDAFETSAKGGSLLEVEEKAFADEGLTTQLETCATAESSGKPNSFNWLRPCEWQAVSTMDAFCAGGFAPSAPALLPGVSLRPIKPDDADACTKLTDQAVASDECTLCQANAFCSACGADNKYCNAFLQAHPDLLRSATNVGTAEAFFVDTELSYWCAADVQTAIKQGTYIPSNKYDVPKGAALYKGAYPESGSPTSAKGISKTSIAAKTKMTLPQRHAKNGELATSRKNARAKKAKIDTAPITKQDPRTAITRRAPDISTKTDARTTTEQERVSAPVSGDHKACTYDAAIERGSYVAIGGYDTVAYWSLPASNGKMPDGTTPMPTPAVAGSPDFAVNHGGHVWYFANEENKQKFLESPNAYVPAFGGFCTWGIAYETWWGCVGDGVLVLPPADPNSWYIKDGKLYFLLFYGLWDWLEEEPGGIDQSLAVASGRWRQCFGDIFETNFMFDGVLEDLLQGTCSMRDGSAPVQDPTDDGGSALPY